MKNLNLEEVQYHIYLPLGDEKAIDAVLRLIKKESLGLKFLQAFQGINPYIPKIKPKTYQRYSLLLFQKRDNSPNLDERVKQIIIDINRASGKTGGVSYSEVKIYKTKEQIP